MGPHEPYWRTNTSFSPPPSRWDFQFQSEGVPYGSHDIIKLYGYSTSSNSKESKSWGPQWTPSAIQEITVDDYETPTRKDPVMRQFSFTPVVEGTSANPDSRGSLSSHSDSSESESCMSSLRNFSGRLSFMSKPINPCPFPCKLLLEKLLTLHLLCYQTMMLPLYKGRPIIGAVPAVALILQMFQRPLCLKVLVDPQIILNVDCVKDFSHRDHLGVLAAL